MRRILCTGSRRLRLSLNKGKCLEYDENDDMDIRSSNTIYSHGDVIEAFFICELLRWSKVGVCVFKL